MNTIDTEGGAMAAMAAYELVYSPILGGGSFVFPCNELGTVELNSLSERARNNYLLARALVGRVFHMPTVVRAVHARC